MRVVLFQPQIPQNTGNVVRTCAVTGTALVLVRPLGFSVTDRWLKRAGLDYWEGVNLSFVDDLEPFLQKVEGRFYFLSSKVKTPYTSIYFHSDDTLIFGSETSGLPAEWLERWPDRFITIPMKEGGGRCLNLATSVGIVLYEAWRQQQFSFSVS